MPNKDKSAAKKKVEKIPLGSGLLNKAAEAAKKRNKELDKIK
jgi:hypothetical protein